MITATVIALVVFLVTRQFAKALFRSPASDTDKGVGACIVIFFTLPSLFAFLICGTWALVRWINT